jgi:hypothetical protein
MTESIKPNKYKGLERHHFVIKKYNDDRIKDWETKHDEAMIN